MPNYVQLIFGKSPFKPMQEHMATCCACATLLRDFVAAAAEPNWIVAESVQARIVELENRADEQKRALRASLPKGFFLPVSRRDLLELLARQDLIANKVRDVAGLMLGRRLRFPEPVSSDLRVFVDACVRTAEQAHDAVKELDELLDTGFRGRETQRVLEMVAEIDLQERRCDEREVELRRSVYEHEPGLSAVDVMFMYRVIESIGELANEAQRVGHRLEQLVA